MLLYSGRLEKWQKHRRERFWGFFRQTVDDLELGLTCSEKEALGAILPLDALRKMASSDNVEDWRRLLAALLQEICTCSYVYAQKIQHYVSRGQEGGQRPPSTAMSSVDVAEEQPKDRLLDSFERKAREVFASACAGEYILSEVMNCFCSLLLNFVRSESANAKGPMNAIALCPSLVKYSKLLKGSEGSVIARELLHVEDFKKLMVSYCLATQ